jgi:uncharacterized repeat protein (TIGR02543 family)
MATALAAANGGAANVFVTGTLYRGRGGGGSNTSLAISGSETRGEGTSSTYSGSAVTYGYGGSGGSQQNASAGSAGSTAAANTGNGGGGAGTGTSSNGNSSLGSNGGAGGSGIVVVRSANTLNITYNANGGSTPSGGSATTVTGGTISTLATTSRAGYTFNGWFTQASGGTQITTSAAHSRTANFTLYAQWTANSNTFTFNNNTGSGTMANQSITTSVTTALTANTFTKTGYTFAGWNTAADASGTSYTNSQSLTVAAGATLYAQWTANSNTFVFNNNTGSGTMANQSITSDVATALTTNSFTKSGFEFAGWNTLANGTGTPYTDGQSITITAGETLYAQWTANLNTFAYSGNTSNGGTTPVGGGSKSFGSTVTVAANTFTKTGYTFTGWNTAANGSGTPYAATGSVTFLMPDAAVTLYAQWTIISSAFAYNGNTSDGGSAPAGGGTKNYAATITVAANSYTKSGYTFDSWNTAANGSGFSVVRLVQLNASASLGDMPR